MSTFADTYSWRPVVDYEGIYEVSWFGCVRRIAGGRGTRPGTTSGRCLKSWASGSKSGLYHRVDLYVKSKRKTRSVHILVATAWLGLPPSDEFGTFEVHHIDNDPSNNCVQNLEWKSKRENVEERWHRYISKGHSAG